MEKVILNYFSLLKRKNYLATSYLFIGDNFLLVKDILKLINCQDDSYFCNNCWNCQRIEGQAHPDLLIIEPEGSFIKIGQIREIQNFLFLKSFYASKKIVLIKGGQLNPVSANAFLKVLEEPPDNSFIAIFTSHLEGMLPTIISRCRKIFLPFRLKENQHSQIMPLIEKFFYGEKIKFRDRRQFGLFLENFITLLRDYLSFRITGRENILINKKNFEIILENDLFKIRDTLELLLNIYSAHNTVNEELALGLIKSSLS